MDTRKSTNVNLDKYDEKLQDMAERSSAGGGRRDNLSAGKEKFRSAANKKNGRGAYICKSLECFKKAKKTKALERSLGVSVSEQVYEELEKEMNQIDR